jgi:hypothetical protein
MFIDIFINLVLGLLLKVCLCDAVYFGVSGIESVCPHTIVMSSTVWLRALHGNIQLAKCDCTYIHANVARFLLLHPDLATTRVVKPPQ